MKYETPDGEHFERMLPARQHVVDRNEDVNHNMAKTMLEKVYPNSDEDEETLDVYEFRFVKHLAAEKTVKVKAAHKDKAQELAEDAMLGQKAEITHTINTESHKLSKVDEVPRSKIESGEYYEADN